MLKNKVLIFDADGVIFNSQPYFKHLVDIGALTDKDVQDFFSSKFRECIVGKYSTTKYMTDFLKAKKIQQETQEVFHNWFAYEDKINQNLLELVKSLNRNNVILLATNQESLRADYIERSQIKKYFDRMYFSCRIGVDKSNPAFFQKIISDHRNELTDFHFWDDNDIPLDSAQLAGICSHKFIDVVSFKKDLKLIR